jgi:O-antigen/teichoic acid export membrane protein
VTRRASKATGSARVSEEAAAEQRTLDDNVDRALRGLFGRDSLYMLIWGIQIVGAALVTPIVTRVMDTAEFGGVAAAYAVMQVTFVVAGLGLSTAIQRQYAGSDGPARARRLLSLALAAALLVIVVLDTTGSLWSAQLGFGSYEGAVRLAVIWAGISAVTNSALALLRSMDRLLVFSCVSLLQSVAAEAASLGLVTTVSPTATMFVLGQLAAQTLALGLALLYLRPALLRRTHSALVRTSLAYGLPLVPAVLSTFVLSAADRFIVQDQLGPSELARYQIAYNIGSMPLLLIGVLSNAWLPRIFALERTRERAAVLAASRDSLYALLIPVVLGLSIGSPLMLRIWAPERYRPDELLLVTALVIVAVLPYTAGMTATRALLAQGHTRWIAGMTLVAAVANVLLNLILVPRYELVGSALATLLAYLLLQRLLVLRPRAVAPIPPTSRTRVLALTGVALAALLASELPTSGLGMVLRSVAVLATVAWFAWQMSSITTAGARGRRRDQTPVPAGPALAVSPPSDRRP